MKYKHLLALTFALACIVLLTACSDSDYVSPSNQARNDLITIVESINEQDPTAIKNLLSSYLLANVEDIDSSIDEMFEFIDGEIVSYDKPFGSACGSLEKKIQAQRYNVLLQIRERNTISEQISGIDMTNILNKWVYITLLLRIYQCYQMIRNQ